MIQLIVDNNSKESMEFEAPQVLDSGVYKCQVTKSYFKTANSGAVAVFLELDIDGKILKSNDYISNKEGKTYYINKKSGDSTQLPGYTKMNKLARMLTQKNIEQQETTQEILINNYNGVTTRTPIDNIDWVGAELTIGVIKMEENKQEKDEFGNYVPVNTKVIKNEIKYFFEPDDILITTFKNKYPKDYILNKYVEVKDTKKNNNIEVPF